MKQPLKFICHLFGHRYAIKRRINRSIAELTCRRCKEEFSINTDVKAVLPMDSELYALHEDLLDNEKGKKLLYEKMMQLKNKEAGLLKPLLTTIAIIATLSTSAQDSTQRDTVAVFERFDTVRVQMMYAARHGVVRHTKGYVIRKGFAVPGKAGWQWVRTPQPVATVDERYKKIDNVIQVF